MDKNDLNSLIYQDSNKYSGNAKTYLQRLKLSLTHTSFKYTSTLRKTNYYKDKNKIFYLFYRWRLLRQSVKYGYQIGVGAEIGGGLYLGHRGTIIVNGGATLGKNISLASGVTIGQENRGKRKGVPKIGNKVWIGTNAVLVGKINIGDDVLIAPNAYVNFDVPNHSIVVGNPAKIISRDNAKKAICKMESVKKCEY